MMTVGGDIRFSCTRGRSPSRSNPTRKLAAAAGPYIAEAGTEKGRGAGTTGWAEKNRSAVTELKAPAAPP